MKYGVWVNSIIAVAGIGAMVIAHWQYTLTFKKLVDEQTQASRDEWKATVIFGIIDAAPITVTQENPFPGLKFEEIHGRYLNAVNSTTGIDIPKEELTSIELKKLLLVLIQNGVIYRTIDDRYLTNRTLVNPRFERTYVDQQAKAAILNLLISNPGKLTTMELSHEICNNHRVQPGEFMTVINSMAAIHEVTVDPQGKVWPAILSPPILVAVPQATPTATPTPTGK